MKSLSSFVRSRAESFDTLIRLLGSLLWRVPLRAVVVRNAKRR